jgi:hypothetical protein
MVKIINDPNRTIAAQLGRATGTGIADALQGLAHGKLNQMLQQQQSERTASGLSALGIPPQEAQQISMLPPDLQSLIVKNYLQGAESAGLNQALMGLNGEGISPEEGLAPQEIEQEVPQQQKISPFATPQEIAAHFMQQQKAAPQSQLRQLNKQNQLVAPESAKKPQSFQDILRNPRLSSDQKLKVAALQQQRQQHLEKLSAKQQQEVDKETKPYYDEIYKGAKAAKESDIRLDRMERLIHRGNLTKPGWVAAVESISKIPVFGVDLSWALHPDTQEFQKLSTDFLKNAKDYFGTRLTDADLKAFLQTIPNAKQTNQAKLRVISNLRSFNEIAKIKKKAADDIIKRNNGRRPASFDSLVDDATAPEVDKIANKFKRNINEDALGVI